MLGRSRPGSEIDLNLTRAVERFVEEIGAQSANTILREGILKTAICMLSKAIEVEFDGYQDIFSAVLRAQADLIDESAAALTQWLGVPPPAE